MSAINFASTILKAQFEGVHPELQQLVKNFAEQSEQSNWPTPVITCAWRDKSGMRAIYYPYAVNIIEKRKRGETLTDSENRVILVLYDIADKYYHSNISTAVSHWVDSKFSWHMVRCAVDLRNKHYTKEQMEAVNNWFKANVGAPLFEYLMHDVGRGDHIHVAIKDKKWRKIHGS